MRRAEILATLRQALPVVQRDYGVRALALFGSVARDEATESSDLDILVDFQGSPTFLSFMGLRAFLEDRFGCKIDLVTRDALKPRLRPAIEREAVNVS